MTRTILEIFISRRRKINPRGEAEWTRFRWRNKNVCERFEKRRRYFFIFFSFFGWISVVVIISIISSTRTAHAMTQTNKWRRVISSGEDSVEMTLLSTGTYI